ncbi:MAG: ABC transporter permease [Acidobacteria bacterium]|nr:ABC transporter permease [Acidobacteriota bacterium]
MRFAFLALRTLRRQGVTVFLLGLPLAFALVLLIVGSILERQAQQVWDRNLSEMGNALWTILPDYRPESPIRGPARPLETLVRRDERLVESEFGDEVAMAAIDGSQMVRFRDRALTITLIGTRADYFQATQRALAVGRLFGPAEDAQAKRVAVIGSKLVDALLGGEWVLGQSILVGNTPFEIIGILAAKGLSSDGAEQDNVVIVPFRAAERRVFNQDYLNRLYVQPPAGLTREPVERALAEAHQKQDFTMREQTKGLNQERNYRSRFRQLLLGSAVLILVLASAGLVFLQWTRVQERVAEWGLLRALGARSHHIAGQVLLEMAGVWVLATAAAIFGLAVLWLVSTAFQLASVSPGWPDLGLPITLTLGFQAILGLIPVLSAVRMEPIHALRSS